MGFLFRVFNLLCLQLSFVFATGNYYYSVLFWKCVSVVVAGKHQKVQSVLTKIKTPFLVSPDFISCCRTQSKTFLSGWLTEAKTTKICFFRRNFWFSEEARECYWAWRTSIRQTYLICRLPVWIRPSRLQSKPVYLGWTRQRKIDCFPALNFANFLNEWLN